MELEYETLISHVSRIVWPLMRISGLFLTMPILSSVMMPVRVRIIFALTLAVIVSPMVSVSMSFLHFQSTHILYVVHELLIGILMGFVLQLVFQVFILTGQIIAMQSGLGFATMVDPASKASVPLVSHFYLLMVSLTFLALNGHLVVLDTLLESFRMAPIGQNEVDITQIASVIQFSGWMFKEAVLIALPAILALLLVNLAFGIMTRVAPQLNIFSLGFPITLIMGMVIIRISLPGVFEQIADSLEQGLLVIKGLLQ